MAEVNPVAEVSPVAAPRWLSDEEQIAWRSFAHVLTRLPYALDRQLHADAGISHIYYWILAMLSESADHAMRMTDVARAANMSQSRASHAVASLERRGWVQRRPCEQDGRGQWATLTDAGWVVVQATAPGHVAEVRRRVFDRLSPAELRELTALAAKLAEGLNDVEG